MKAKIDLEKFISSMLGYAEDNCEETMLDYLRSALQDQDLEYKDGEIVEIEQEQPYNKPFFFEKGKWYTCIAKVNGFKVGHIYQSKMDGTVSNDSGAMYGYHNDVNLIFRPATDDEIPKEQEEREDLRKRYERIGNSDWFKKTHEGMSATIPDDLKGTDPDGGVVGEKGEQGEIPFKEHMENLKKRIEDNQLGCIVQRLDKIIELLSWKPSPNIIPYPYTMPITYKRPLDPDPNVLGGWTTTASTFGSDYDIDTDKIKQDETNKPES